MGLYLRLHVISWWNGQFSGEYRTTAKTLKLSTIMKTRTLVKVLGFAGTLAVLVVVISSCSSRADAQTGPKVTQKVFFDITIGGSNAGTIEIGLLAMWCPELSRTLPRWPLGPSPRGTRAAPSTESSATSCCRAETSPEETELAGSPSTETSSRTRTSSE